MKGVWLGVGISEHIKLSICSKLNTDWVRIESEIHNTADNSQLECSGRHTLVDRDINVRWTHTIICLNTQELDIIMYTRGYLSIVCSIVYERDLVRGWVYRVN